MVALMGLMKYIECIKSKRNQETNQSVSQYIQKEEVRRGGAHFRERTAEEYDREKDESQSHAGTEENGSNLHSPRYMWVQCYTKILLLFFETKVYSHEKGGGDIISTD